MLDIYEFRKKPVKRGNNSDQLTLSFIFQRILDIFVFYCLHCWGFAPGEGSIPEGWDKLPKVNQMLRYIYLFWRNTDGSKVNSSRGRWTAGRSPEPWGIFRPRRSAEGWLTEIDLMIIDSESRCVKMVLEGKHRGWTDDHVRSVIWGWSEQIEHSNSRKWPRIHFVISKPPKMSEGHFRNDEIR